MTLLDDDFVRGTGGTHQVVEPATGETLGGVGIAAPEDVAKAAAIA
jgi:benzaldehyde dehydrogenase (NAD)